MTNDNATAEPDIESRQLNADRSIYINIPASRKHTLDARGTCSANVVNS